MNYEQYKAKRELLLKEAQDFLDTGKVQDAKMKREEIEQLDTDFEAAARENANLSALQKTGIVKQPQNSAPAGELTPAGETEEKPAEPNTSQSKLYRAAFAKIMMKQGLSQDEKTCFNAVNNDFKMKTQTAEEHGVLIPNTMREQIWMKVAESHPILQDVLKTFVPGALTIPQDTDIMKDGEWTDEATAATGDDVSFAELKLTGCELVKAVTVSWKMRKMSIDAFMTYITTKIAEKMGNALAKAILTGKGKPGETDTFKAQPMGIITALTAEKDTPQVITYDTGKLDYKTITSARALITSAYSSGCAIYAKSTDVWNVLANIVDGIKRPIFVPDPTGQCVGRLFGIPVKEEDGLPEGAFLMGNVAAGYTMNVNEDMTMYKEEHIMARTADYMGYSIIDGGVLTTKAFAVIQLITTAPTTGA